MLFLAIGLLAPDLVYLGCLLCLPGLFILLGTSFLGSLFLVCGFFGLAFLLACHFLGSDMFCRGLSLLSPFLMAMLLVMVLLVAMLLAGDLFAVAFLLEPLFGMGLLTRLLVHKLLILLHL